MVIRFFLFLLILNGCSTGGLKERALIKGHVKSKNYKLALLELKTSKEYQNINQALLLHLEKGMIFHREGHYQLSISELEKAKKISNKLYTKSIKGKIKKAIMNENYDIYYGEVYERSMTHFYLSLNHFLRYQIEQKKEDLLKARAEILSWDSFLEGVRASRLGKSIFKFDLMLKIFGAFIHQRVGGVNELQAALQLYRDARTILFQNYNGYGPFNKKSVAFKRDYEKLPKMKKKDVQKTYIEETLLKKQLKNFLDFKILSLAKRIRPRKYQNYKRQLSPDKDVLNRLKKKYQKENISLILHHGMIPNKIASKQYYSLERALTPDKPSKGSKLAAKVGSAVIMVFAAHKMNLLPPPQNFSPIGMELGVRLAAYSGDALAIAFELPMMEAAPVSKVIKIQAQNEAGEVIRTIDLPLINPLGAIAAEAIAEHSSSRYAYLGARLATKHLSAIAASFLTYKMSKESLGPFFAGQAALGQYLLASKGIEQTERADTRYWATLPANLRFTSFYLPKGKYNLIGIDTDKNRMNLGPLVVGEQEHRLINILHL